MCERVDGTAGAKETPIGLMPEEGGLDLDGLDISDDDMAELLNANAESVKEEISDIQAHFDQFGERLPERLTKQLAALKDRLDRSGDILT
jgi:phosphoenolpyruvate carboxykinase (GTP)